MLLDSLPPVRRDLYFPLRDATLREYLSLRIEDACIPA